MYYNDEVRLEQEFNADVSLVQPGELKLATAFVEALAAPFDPEGFRDDYRAQLQALIEAKAVNRRIAMPAPHPPPAAPVVDIMEALKKSLAAARKPAQQAKRPVDASKRAQPPRRRRA
jgi:DNA end-binding protein Ku